MPVHFRGQSEYKTNYRWLESIKSKSFHPAPEQAMDPAGTPSIYASPVMEPPLQHKKRLDGPPTSLSTEYFSVPSRAPEYALLGQQEKFAQNVRYQTKQPAPGQMYKNKENFDDAPPPSKQLKMQKRIKPLIKERHPPISRSPPRQSNTQPTAKSSLESPPPAPRGHRDNVELKEALKDKDLKDILGEKPSAQPVQSKTKDRVPEKAQNEQKKEVTSNMNEFVQTDMRKGVAMSAPEAPAEYALKYKAGVAPPRPVQKVSEYQKQFQWKKGIKASPLLAAEEIVYRSNADLGPYKTDGVPRLSEYARQFQPWKPLAYAADVNLNVNNSNINNNNNVSREDDWAAGKKKTKAKRSKSAGAVLRQDEFADQINDAEAGGYDSDELKTKLKKTHGKIRRVATEYRSNYKSPTRFSYEQGAWRGACPPQLMPQLTSDEDTMNKNNNNNNNNNSNNNTENPPLSNWFAEVIELRRRAAEYRKRAQGTHFSREHLLQLMAKQNECWDSSSQTSSIIKALDLETPAVKSNLPQEKLMLQTAPVDICSHEATEGDSPIMSDVENLEEQSGKKKKGRRGGKKHRGRKSRKMAWLEEQKETVAEQRRKLEAERERQEMGDDALYEEELNEGRLPTPLLQQNVAAARRHHLDLTTPSVGGAILTCPPSKDSKIIVTSRSGDSYVTASDDYPSKTQQKQTYSMDRLLTAPVLGMPSGDSHALRDDSADSDRPLRTQYVVSPPFAEDEEDKENASKAKQVKKRSKGLKPNSLTAVQEGYGKTYNKSKPYVDLADIKGDIGPKDDDVMSVSLMSVASSSSLASDILERTKKRQEFWNSKNKGAC